MPGSDVSHHKGAFGNSELRRDIAQKPSHVIWRVIRLLRLLRCRYAGARGCSPGSSRSHAPVLRQFERPGDGHRACSSPGAVRHRRRSHAGALQSSGWRTGERPGERVLHPHAA